jgi:hypothetical protein
MQSVPVAWPPCRGYAARVSRFHFQRWAVIFLLVSKLIFGEVTHAMPSMAAPATQMNEVAASASQDSPPCANHVQAGSQVDPSHDSNSNDSNGDEPAKKDCCKSGGCACPCLHSPAATAAIVFSMQRANDNQIAVPVGGAVWHRLSALFRPPA